MTNKLLETPTSPIDAIKEIQTLTAAKGVPYRKIKLKQLRQTLLDNFPPDRGSWEIQGWVVERQINGTTKKPYVAIYTRDSLARRSSYLEAQK